MSREIGENLRRHRMAAGITQETLAHAAGLAPSTVAKLEQGGGVRIETLHKIARALHMKTSQLMASDTPEPIQKDGVTNIGLAELRGALMPPVNLSESAIKLPREAPDTNALSAVISRGSAVYAALKFDKLAASLPEIIRSADAAVSYYDNGEEHTAALSVRSEAYLLGGRYLTQTRHYDLAYHALSRSIRDARAVDDVDLAAKGIGIMSWLMTRQGRFDDAERLALTAAEHIEPKISATTPNRLSAWGWLALHAASAAIRNNRPDMASEARRIAASAASAMGQQPAEIRPVFGHFDSAIAQMKALEDELIKDDGDPYVVIEESTGKARLSDGAMKAAGVPETDNEWNRHRLTVAAAYAEVREFDKAFERLTAIEYQCAGWLSHQKGARDVMDQVARKRKRKLTVDMRRMMVLLGTTA